MSCRFFWRVSLWFKICQNGYVANFSVKLVESWTIALLRIWKSGIRTASDIVIVLMISDVVFPFALSSVFGNSVHLEWPCGCLLMSSHNNIIWFHSERNENTSWLNPKIHDLRVLLPFYAMHFGYKKKLFTIINIHWCFNWATQTDECLFFNCVIEIVVSLCTFLL